jgi:threonine/homoserine/homoserine lactone efflux protein
VIEAVILYLLSTIVVLGLGTILQNMPGIFYAVFAQSTAYLVQTAWLWKRSQPISRHIDERDNQEFIEPAQRMVSP